jgi:hypothetical protein
MKRALTFLVVTTLELAFVVSAPAAETAPGDLLHTEARAPFTPLAACTDTYDPNQTCGTGPLLSPGVYSGLRLDRVIPPTGDQDWYRVHLRRGETIRATMTFPAHNDTAQIALSSPACGAYLASYSGSGTVFSITHRNTGAEGDYRLGVAHNDAGGCFNYTLSISISCDPDAFEPNNVCSSATPLSPGSYSGLSVDWALGAGDTYDWYKVHLVRSEKLVLDLSYLHINGDIDGDIWTDCSMSTSVGRFIGDNDGDHVEISNDGPEADWFIRIWNESNTCAGYNMSVAIVPTANLDNTVTYGGWSGPIVPTSGPASWPPVVTPTLDGNANTTYFNWAMKLTGPKATPESHSHLDGDGELRAFFIAHEPFPSGDWGIQTFEPTEIRGGRHTLTTVHDYFGSLPETNETDNRYSEQFVWSPLAVANGSPLARNAPPERGPSVYPNSDGFVIHRDPFTFDWVTSIASFSAPDDYDLYVYDDYSGSTSGFTHYVGGSGQASTSTDFVVGSYNYPTFTLYPAVIRFAGGYSGFCIDQNEDQGRVILGTGDMLWADQSMGPYRLADVYSFHADAGETIHLTLRRKTGISDLAFEVFPTGSGGIFGRGTGTPSAPVDPSLDELTVAIPTTGYYPLAVFRTTGETADASLTYDFGISRNGLLAAPMDSRESTEVSFAGAAPNPMSQGGRFEFSLPRPGRVVLGLFDLHGRRVRSLAEGEFPAGHTQLRWDGRGEDRTQVGAGVYWAKLSAEGRDLTRRVIVIP